MIALKARWLLTGLLWLALLSACAAHAPGGAAYINKENPTPNSQASHQAIRLCSTRIDPASLEVAEGGKRAKSGYKEGRWWKFPLVTLLSIVAMTPGGPEFYEEFCNNECRQARLEIHSKFDPCMIANGGWIRCWRGSSGRSVCQKKP